VQSATAQSKTELANFVINSPPPGFVEIHSAEHARGIACILFLVPLTPSLLLFVEDKILLSSFEDLSPF
jgi:hypothetical protein